MRLLTPVLLLLAASVGAVERVSPHHPPTPYEPGPSCAACHTSPPERGAPPPQANLIAEPGAACKTCHPAAPHAGVVEHLGKPLPEHVQATLPEALALTEKGRIACWTCHEVHTGGGAGVVRKSRLSRALTREQHGTLPGAERARPALLALPLEGGALCRACHGDGPALEATP